MSVDWDTRSCEGIGIVTAGAPTGQHSPGKAPKMGSCRRFWGRGSLPLGGDCVWLVGARRAAVRRPKRRGVWLATRAATHPEYRRLLPPSSRRSRRCGKTRLVLDFETRRSKVLPPSQQIHSVSSSGGELDRAPHGPRRPRACIGTEGRCVEPGDRAAVRTPPKPIPYLSVCP